MVGSKDRRSTGWRVAAVAIAITLATPLRASATEPATAPAPAAPTQPVPQTWDDVVVDTPPAPPPTPTPAPVVEPPREPRLTRPSDAVLEETRRSSNALFIGAGATAAVATLLNGLRVFIVTTPCQTPQQEGCTVGFFFTSPFTIAANAATLGLAGAGARERGVYDGWVYPDKHRRRSSVMLSVGIPLIALGFASSVALRGLWLSDYLSPENGTLFDFARPGHALAYYGGQQLSAMAVAAGIGMVSYHMAGAKIRRYSGVASPWIGGSVIGLRYVARF